MSWFKSKVWISDTTERHLEWRCYRNQTTENHAGSENHTGSHRISNFSTFLNHLATGLHKLAKLVRIYFEFIKKNLRRFVRSCDALRSEEDWRKIRIFWKFWAKIIELSKLIRETVVSLSVFVHRMYTECTDSAQPEMNALKCTRGVHQHRCPRDGGSNVFPAADQMTPRRGYWRCVCKNKSCL